jgi:hypothetical protein
MQDHANRQAIHAQLPWARIVVDPFHLVVRGAGLALDTGRRERQPRQPAAVAWAVARGSAPAGVHSSPVPATGCGEPATLRARPAQAL